MTTTSESPNGSTSPSTSSNLNALLQSAIPSSDRDALRNSVLPKLIASLASVATTLRSSQSISLAGTANSFGDDQLNVDVIAERIIRKAIAECTAVVSASSEEDPVERPARDGESIASGSSREQYTIAFDPLDGSSIIAPNWTVGTIIGIWDGPSALKQLSSEKQIAAILGVYGPRTTAIVALRIPGTKPVCIEVGLGSKGEEVTLDVNRAEVQLLNPPFKTRYFAPANLRAAAEDENYSRLITHFIQNKYTLRYSGGLVPDVVHALVKGHGVYVSPVTSVSKAKLRRLYELAPIALIVECAGGAAVDPVDGKPVLERAIADCDERGGLICGTVEDVELAIKELLSTTRSQ